uniref:Uncharacterized protein n=1 Tax=uncultured marine virus TaxID=186617 RepID=A0A0F7L352_9VIRU|nr:hypothetical protein [uncultured marine virus]
MDSCTCPVSSSGCGTVERPQTGLVFQHAGRQGYARNHDPKLLVNLVNTHARPVLHGSGFRQAIRMGINQDAEGADHLNVWAGGHVIHIGSNLVQESTHALAEH